MNKSILHRLEVPNRSVALCAGTKITGVVRARYLAGLVALVALLPTLAIATPSSGIKSGTVFARATFADPTDVEFAVTQDGKKIVAVTDARETVTQEIVIAPGGTTGWHSHPGPVVVLIKSGQMAFYDGDDLTCSVRIYSTGESFVDRGQGHVHIAHNEGSVDLVLWATYFDVPSGGAFRIDAPDPGICHAKPANISTRGFVQTSDNVMIGGFILRGASGATVIVRAIGPSMSLPGTLQDPFLELFDRNGTSIASNNDWRDTQELEIIATGIPPNDNRESAIVRTLAPGDYTAVVRGMNQMTGVALVEVYSLD